MKNALPKTFLAAIAIAVTTFSNIAAANAIELLLAVANFNTSNETLVSIDRNTGLATAIGTLDSQMAPFGLSDRGGQLYTYDQLAQRIREIDPNTGATLATIDVGISPFGEGAIAFRSDGIGFMGSGGLFTFDVTGPSGSFINNYFGFSPPSMDGMDFDPVTGVLYGISSAFTGGAPNQNKLYTIDEVTATPTIVGATGVSDPNLGGLTFTEDGTLYAILNGQLYELNTSTGAATLVGSTGGFSAISGLTAITLADAVPEPGTTLLLAACVGMLGFVRRRRRTETQRL